MGCCEWYHSVSQPSYIQVSISFLSYIHISFDHILFSIGLVRFVCHLKCNLNLYIPIVSGAQV